MGLSLLLALWMFAFASHIHAPDEHGTPQKSAQHCGFCLSLPGAAAAPAEVSLPPPRARFSRPVARATASITSEFFAYYQSRAPPVS